MSVQASLASSTSFASVSVCSSGSSLARSRNCFASQSSVSIGFDIPLISYAATYRPLLGLFGFRDLHFTDEVESVIDGSFRNAVLLEVIGHGAQDAGNPGSRSEGHTSE